MFKSKKLSLLMALVFAFTVIFPVAAFAATGYEALQIPNVDDDTVDELGTVVVEMRDGAIDPGDSVIFRLPSDFQFVYDKDTDGKVEKDEVMTDSEWQAVSSVADATYDNFIEVPESYSGNKNILDNNGIDITKLDDNEIKVTVKDDAVFDTEGESFYLLLHFGAVYIDEDFSGDIELSASGPSTSGFPSGEVVVGRVAGGMLDITVIDDPTFSEDTDKASDPVTIRIEEDIKGALEKDDDSLKFVLPSGFEWQNPTNGDLEVVWGDDNQSFGYAKDATDDIVVYADGDELIIDVNDTTEEATCWELTLGIDIEDENDARTGDVVAKVRGGSDVSVSEITVGHYGDYGVEIEVDGDAPQILAGMLEQEIADVKIIESVKESLVDGRTVILTLPSNAKWGAIDDKASDGGVDLVFTGFVGDDGKSIKYEVVGESSDAAELTLEDFEVVLEPGVEGDLVVEVSGTAGLSGELKLAEVVAPITAEAGAKTSVKIGAQGQLVSDITITEGIAGAVKDDKDIIVDLPDGIKFTSEPTVEVTEGDLEIDEAGVKRQNDDNELLIPIDRDSTEASTIVISDIEYTVDRTVAEGDILVKIKGNAVVEVNDDAEMEDYWGSSDGDEAGYDEDDAVYFETNDGSLDKFDVKADGLFPASSTAAEVVNATTATPAPGDTKLTTSITLGDNGSYISDGRIMVQLRDAATALGVAEQNIFWDNNTKSVTFIKGDRVVQLTVGDPQVKLNGTALPTDKGAEIKDGRTYVSLRAAGIAFGAVAEWDNDNKVATLTIQ